MCLVSFTPYRTYGLKHRIFYSHNTYHLGYDKIGMTRAFWSVAEHHVPERRLFCPATTTQWSKYVSASSRRRAWRCSGLLAGINLIDVGAHAQVMLMS